MDGVPRKSTFLFYFFMKETSTLIYLVTSFKSQCGFLNEVGEKSLSSKKKKKIIWLQIYVSVTFCSLHFTFVYNITKLWVRRALAKFREIQFYQGATHTKITI